MVKYPQLSEYQQKTLPTLIESPTSIQAKFTDSSHQLWLCKTTEGLMVLKVCHRTRIKASAFWLGMNGLFQLDFPQSLNTTQQTSCFLKMAGLFQVPEVIAEQAGQFVLVRFIHGQDLNAKCIEDIHVEQLAHHIRQCHQQISINWGTLSSPSLAASQWPIRLEKTIQRLSEQTAFQIPDDLRQKVNNEIKLLQSSQFVPVMPDFRWDQLRQTPDGQIALLDLDAFVRAPRELELVLLEYLLTPAQAVIFSEIYGRYHDWPDLSACRLSYRILLFLMYVFGETDIETWLNQPTPFSANENGI